MIRKSLAFAAAAALTATPVMAEAASSLSVANSPAVRASAETGDSALVDRGVGGMGWLIPGLVLVAVVVGAILLLDDDDPDSP